MSDEDDVLDPDDADPIEAANSTLDAGADEPPEEEDENAVGDPDDPDDEGDGDDDLEDEDESDEESVEPSLEGKPMTRFEELAKRVYPERGA